MLEKIQFDNIIKSKIVAGVELLLKGDGKFEINFSLLKKNKSTNK